MMDATLWLVGGATLVASDAAIGYWIGRMKGGRETDGGLLGATLGPIGWIIVAMLPAKGKELTKFARRGFAGVAIQPGQLHESTVRVRCPNCGEQGAVRPETETATCPTCAEKFSARGNLAA